jgi:hypothetical protein
MGRQLAPLRLLAAALVVVASSGKFICLGLNVADIVLQELQLKQMWSQLPAQTQWALCFSVLPS